MSQKQKKLCYYCGQQTTSREHVPPKLMFRGFSCDSITVPACDEHNTVKGVDDQAIISAFLIPLQNMIDANIVSKQRIETNVQKALKIGQTSFRRAKRRAYSHSLLSNMPQKLGEIPNVSYVTPSADIRGWIQKVTAALVYDGIKSFDESINWDNITAWSPDFIETNGSFQLPFEQVGSTLLDNRQISILLETLSWHKGWSAYPKACPSEIYSFQIHFQENDVVVKHRFYNQYTWYVWLSPSRATIANLKQKVACREGK